MKMVKSLLLGSAAGLVAVTGTQAADLPVKAKPVEYVKVCSLYGAGFYYMPGTDICLKLGGYVRNQHYWMGGDGTQPLRGANVYNNRHSTNQYWMRARTIVTIDTRQQTAYGTLRTYLLIGATWDTNQQVATGAAALYATRAFIQIAGFTFGRATSFFDIVPGATFAYYSGSMHIPDTGDGGQLVAAYTGQLGNGLSWTIAAEQPRDGFVVNTIHGAGMTAASPFPTYFTNTYASQMPDVVANLRVDQAWGFALIAAALHDNSASYYGTTASVDVSQDRPKNAYGWALTGGFLLNLPWIAPGDRFTASVVLAEGAGRYASINSSNGVAWFKGDAVGLGFGPDGVFGLGGPQGFGFNSPVEQTKFLSVAGAFEHLWTPALKTSLYASYLKVDFNDQATGLICGTQTFSNPRWSPGCNPDWSTFNVGSRTQWEPVKGFYMGVDVIYQKINTATQPGQFATNISAGAASGRPSTGYHTADQELVSATFRIHRDFLP